MTDKSKKFHERANIHTESFSLENLYIIRPELQGFRGFQKVDYHNFFLGQLPEINVNLPRSERYVANIEVPPLNGESPRIKINSNCNNLCRDIHKHIEDYFKNLEYPKLVRPLLGYRTERLSRDKR